MQQLIRRDEHSSDDQSNLEIIDDDEQDDEQCQNLAGIKIILIFINDFQLFNSNFYFRIH